MTTPEPPRFRPKIEQIPIEQAPPSKAMPAKVELPEWTLPAKTKKRSIGRMTLLFGGLSAFGFMTFNTVTALISQFDQYPISASVLGAFFVAFIGGVATLAGREVKGYLNVNRYVAYRHQLKPLESETERKVVVTKLGDYAAQFSQDSYAALCYRHFRQRLSDDMSANEVWHLYQRLVTQAVNAKAREVLRKESMVAGSMSFISPNHLMQTMMIVWTSLRTIRRLSLVFGLRPGTLGNWHLLKILAQNLAAQSVFDLATDELVNQISGSLSAKLVENSAEAVAASALNVRLGRALINLLQPE